MPLETTHAVTSVGLAGVGSFHLASTAAVSALPITRPVPYLVFCFRFLDSAATAARRFSLVFNLRSLKSDEHPIMSVGTTGIRWALTMQGSSDLEMAASRMAELVRNKFRDAAVLAHISCLRCANTGEVRLWGSRPYSGAS